MTTKTTNPVIEVINRKQEHIWLVGRVDHWRERKGEEKAEDDSAHIGIARNLLFG